MSAMSSPRTSSSARARTSPGDEPVPRVRPQQRAQLAHRGGGAQVVPDDVPDREADRAVGQRQHVEPVAAHLGAPGRRHVRGGDVEPGDVAGSRAAGCAAASARRCARRGTAARCRAPGRRRRPRWAAVTTASGVKPSTATRHSTPSTRSRARSGTTSALPRPSRRSSGELLRCGPGGQARDVDRVRASATKPGAAVRAPRRSSATATASSTSWLASVPGPRRGPPGRRRRRARARTGRVRR